MSVKLLERTGNLAWTRVRGGLAEARARVTPAAWQLIELAHQRGLAVHVWGTARTEIVGTLGHQLSIGHKPPEPGRPRLTRIRMCKLDGWTVESRVTLARAREWIAAQPKPARPLRTPRARAGAS